MTEEDNQFYNPLPNHKADNLQSPLKISNNCKR